MESLKQLEVDNEALRRGLALALADPDPLRRQQIRHKLQAVERGEFSWQSVAEFACYGLQGQNLSLKPWECPPMHACPGATGHGRYYFNQPKAAALRQRLVDAGLSIFEPDPLGALAKIEAATA
jgi:hypothetical protein